MPPTHMTSCVSPAWLGDSSGALGLTTPLAIGAWAFCATPLLFDSRLSLDDSKMPWPTSEGTRCRGFDCFCLAMVVVSAFNRYLLVLLGELRSKDWAGSLLLVQ